MKSLTRIAAIALAALFPLTLTSPAFAVGFNRLNFTVDCLSGEIGEDDHVHVPTSSAIINLENCAGYYIADLDDTGNVTMIPVGMLTSSHVVIPGGTAALNIDGNANIQLIDTDLLSPEPGWSMDIDVYLAGEGDDPDSTLLATEELTLELGAPDMEIRSEMVGDSEGDSGYGTVFMGGDEDCQVEPGPHVYTTLDFTVTTAGTFDFRAIAVDPIDEDLNWGVSKYPSSDPFIAVYSAFDPANPETGLVGCNDDADESGISFLDDMWYDAVNDTTYEGLVYPSGHLVEDQWPWFRTELPLGEYTVVYFPFAEAGTEDFDNGQFATTSLFNSDVSWDPIAQTVTYEMWGPEGGLELGHTLADTGVNPAFALWSGLALAGTGIAITVARRRGQRA
jgi:hypothetical protein